MSQGQWHFVLFFAALFHVSLFHYKNRVFFSGAKNQLKDWPGVAEVPPRFDPGHRDAFEAGKLMSM